jgi:hypothetical protein
MDTVVVDALDVGFFLFLEMSRNVRYISLLVMLVLGRWDGSRRRQVLAMIMNNEIR